MKKSNCFLNEGVTTNQKQFNFGKSQNTLNVLSFSFSVIIRNANSQLPNEILRCTFRLKKVIWRVVKSIRICN